MFYVTFFTTKLLLISDGLKNTRDGITLNPAHKHWHTFFFLKDALPKILKDILHERYLCYTQKKKKKKCKEVSINSTWFIFVCNYVHSGPMNLHVSIQICPSSHFDVTAISPCPKNWQSTEKNHVQGRLEAQPVSVNKDAYKRLKSRLRWRPRTFRSIHPKENKDIFEKRRKVSFIF